MDENIKLTAKMESFLKNSRNKEDLFDFLSRGIDCMDRPPSKQVFITFNDLTLSKGTVKEIGRCDHEESDSRVMVHICHAVKNGGRNIFLSLGDVVIISL